MPALTSQMKALQGAHYLSTIVNRVLLLHIYIQCAPMAPPHVTMEMSVWWEVPLSMRVEWRFALMTSGELCVTTPGTALMLLWSVNRWDMLTPEVSTCIM